MDLLQVVKSYFANVGIDMEIRTMDAAAWQSFARAWKADQLLYCETGSLGLTFSPLRSINRFSTNYVVNWCMVNDPTFNAFGPKALAASTVNEVKQVVADSAEYVSQQHYCISLLQPNTFTLYQPWIKGYNGQIGALTPPGATRPAIFIPYVSRFWIDQTLKKSAVN